MSDRQQVPEGMALYKGEFVTARMVVERLADKEILLAQAVEYGSGYKQAHDEAMDNYQMTLARLAEAEALLRDIRDDLDIGAHPQLYKDRIDAYLAREEKP